MRGTYLRVGLLVVLGAGLLLGMAFFLSGSRVSGGQTYETYFRDSVQGLDVGAAVKYRGVQIGSVTQIGLSSAEYGKGAPDEVRRATFRTVFVRFVIDPARIGSLPNAETVSRAGLRARIAPQGLTGQSYIELDYTNAPDRYPPLQVPWTPRYPYIPSEPGLISEVQNAATLLLGKLEQVDVNGLADSAGQVLGDLHRILQPGGDAQLALSQARATLTVLQAGLTQADIPALAGEVRQTLAAARQLAGGPQTRDLLRSATLATDRLSQAAARLPQLLALVDAVAQRADSSTADLQAALVPLLRDTRTTVAALRETSEAIRRDPAQVVLGAPPPRRDDR